MEVVGRMYLEPTCLEILLGQKNIFTFVGTGICESARNFEGGAGYRTVLGSDSVSFLLVGSIFVQSFALSLA